MSHLAAHSTALFELRLVQLYVLCWLCVLLVMCSVAYVFCSLCWLWYDNSERAVLPYCTALIADSLPLSHVSETCIYIYIYICSIMASIAACCVEWSDRGHDRTVRGLSCPSLQQILLTHLIWALSVCIWHPLVWFSRLMFLQVLCQASVCTAAPIGGDVL